MSKKKIAIISVAAVAAVALLALLTVYLISVFSPSDSGGKESTGKPTISAGTVTASAGDTVKVPIEFTGNPGAMGFLFDISYDADSLEYITYEKGELLSDCEVSGGDGALKLLSVENENITDDGVMAYISFKVKDGASGDCAVKVICEENSVCNYDEEAIAVETSDGKVTVK